MKEGICILGHLPRPTKHHHPVCANVKNCTNITMFDCIFQLPEKKSIMVEEAYVLKWHITLFWWESAQALNTMFYQYFSCNVANLHSTPNLWDPLFKCCMPTVDPETIKDVGGQRHHENKFPRGPKRGEGFCLPASNHSLTSKQGIHLPKWPRWFAIWFSPVFIDMVTRHLHVKHTILTFCISSVWKSGPVQSFGAQCLRP